MSHNSQSSFGSRMITRIVAILLSFLLLACLIIPIQQARKNTREQYHDLYIYKNKAQLFYRATRSACINLDALNHSTLQFLTQTYKNGGDYTLAILNARTKSYEILMASEKLERLVCSSYQGMKLVPDPGRSDIVNAVNDYFDAYCAYYDFVTDPQSDYLLYQETNQKLIKQVNKKSNELRKLIIDN